MRLHEKLVCRKQHAASCPQSGREETSAGRSGFTFIELLVVVAVIAIASGVLLPVIIQAYDRARSADAQQAALQSANRQPDVDRMALPTGPAPIIDSVDLKMVLASSYHRVAMDVFTRYRVDCTGRIVFRCAADSKDGRVVLYIPFPANILEARNVDLRVSKSDNRGEAPRNEIVYAKRGVYCTCVIDRGQAFTADVSFTALGRDQFDYPLPPARQLRSVSIMLDLSGVQSYTIPDDSLQPGAIEGHHLLWQFTNLVSDRQIAVLIPAAQAPMARVLLLSRLVALAVLLFGAGFWYLSEQSNPGQLDGFRLGHFLLLALTYSLFFIIFAVLEFHGGLGTAASMAVSALFSLPLLILHASRILNLRFAVTRVMPLALFTLGLVINGVYGGPIRDYIFIGVAIFIIAFVTLDYQSWSARRERHRQQQEAANGNRNRDRIATAVRENEVHCIACGQRVPDAPFCQQCGAAQPAIGTCAGCGERVVIPLHLLAQNANKHALCCTRCGMRVALSTLQMPPRDG